MCRKREGERETERDERMEEEEEEEEEERERGRKSHISKLKPRYLACSQLLQLLPISERQAMTQKASAMRSALYINPSTIFLRSSTIPMLIK